MTETILASIPSACSRTGKTHSLSMPLEEIAPYLAREAKKADAAASISAAVQGVEAAPDLIVFWKGKLHLLNTVHESSDDAVSRYVNAILKKDVYDVPPPRTRSAKEPAEGGETPAEGSAEPKKRGRKPKAASEAPDEDFDLVVDEA